MHETIKLIDIDRLTVVIQIFSHYKPFPRTSLSSKKIGIYEDPAFSTGAGGFSNANNFLFRCPIIKTDKDRDNKDWI